MSFCRQVTSSLVRPTLIPAILIITFFSCRVPKDYQVGKPFVFKTSVKVTGSLKTDQRQDLTSRLESQLDDSLQPKTITALSWPQILIKKLPNPPVFDSASITRSVSFMTAFLNSGGYYSPQIKDSIMIQTLHKGDTARSGKNKGVSLEQQRVTVSFTVKPGMQLVFDSVGFSLETPELQRIAIESRDQSLIKVGNPYSRQVLTNEINRLVDSFRNQGYYRFSKEDIYVEHDTVFAALIDPSLDPIEQAELLEKLKKRKENPTVTVTLKQRPVRDSLHLVKFHIGTVTVYPDLPVGVDSLQYKNDTSVIRGMTFISQTKKFKLPFIADNIYMLPGGLYKQQNYFFTSNRLSQFPAWEYNNIIFQNLVQGDSLLNITVRMYPAKKQKLSVSFETSYNTNDILTSSNTLGTSLIFGLQNRNNFKQSIMTNTNLQGGFEFGSNFIQTILTGLSHTYTIPHIVPIVPFLKFPANLEKKGYHTGTVINLTAAYVQRLNLFTQITVNVSFGYEWSKTQMHSASGRNIIVTKSYLWKPINIENTTLPVQQPQFLTLLAENPPLALSFRPGLVIGQQFAYNIIRQKGNKTNYLLIGFEQSGALLGFIKQLDTGRLLRYFLGSVEFRHHIDYGKNQLVFRVFAGAGYDYGLAGQSSENTLPFFKAFYAGGPNSMRAWQVRSLGLGSSKYYSILDTTAKITNLRFGDVKLEGNVEYRFLLGTLFGIKFRSAVFTDIGNIWSWKPITDSASGTGSDFHFNSFYKELAVDAGTGLRIDFNYFLLRFDWAYKLKNPGALDGKDGWFSDISLGSGQLQLGINYPF